MRRLAAATALLSALAGCGGGERVSQSREVEPFDRIEVSDDLDVRIVPGDAGTVTVYAGEDVLDRIHTESGDGVLRLDIRDRGIVIGPDPLGDARVEVAASDLAGVTVEGSGDVTISGIDAERLALSVEGSGEIDASGTVDRLEATIEGAGDANLSALEARTAVLTVQGAAEADLSVSDELDVRIEGAGDVTYRGNPRVSSIVEGAGELRREGP